MADPAARCRVAIVGAGPAGLAAALTLRERGVDHVTVLEREAEPGGVPRHCGHPVFGMREFGRILSGPGYARRLAEAVRRPGIELRTGVSVLALEPAGRLRLATADGLADMEASRVILATGVRETPRSARLVGGDRPAGVITTGTLQAFVYLEHRRPFRRPVIVGTELVSFSAILTAMKGGMRPVAMLEEGPRAVARWPSVWTPRLLGIPVHLGARITEIRGRNRVEAVEFEQDGRRRTLACDGVLFTGRFVPAAELVRASHLGLDPASGGPVIDQYGRCTDPAFFAAGNLLRPVETAGWSYREGRRVGAFVADDLEGRLPSATHQIRIDRGSGISLAVPQRLSLPLNGKALGDIQLRVARAISGQLIVEAEGKPLWRRRVSVLPERRVVVPLADLSIPDGSAAIRIGIVNQ